MNSLRQKINIRYLPAKAHYFLFCGGISGVVPYLPMFAKNLGISPELVGVIYATLPCVQLVTKPIFSSFADKTATHKNMLVWLITTMVVFLFSVSFLPEIPQEQSSQIVFVSNLTCESSQKILSSCPSIETDRYNNSLICNSICNVTSIDSLSENKTSLIRENSTFYFSFSSTIEEIDSQLENCSEFQINYTDQFNNSSMTLCRSDFPSLCNHQCSFNNSFQAKTKDAIYFRYQFWWLFIAMVISWICYGLIVSIGDTVVYSLLEEERHLFGLQRLWGTIGWGLMILVTGFFDSVASSNAGKLDYSPGFYIFAILLFIDLFNIRRMTFNFEKPKSRKIADRLLNLLKTPRIAAFTMIVFLIGLLTGVMESFLFWYLADLGSGSILLGLSRTVQCFLGELPAFVVSGWILRLIGHVNALSLVLAVFGLRFLLYSLLINPWWTLPIELCHSATFGLFYATMTGYASTVAPSGMATTLQGVMSASYEGAGFAVGSFCGGFVYGQHGGRNTFLYFGLLAFVFCILNVITQVIINRSDRRPKLPMKDYPRIELSNMMPKRGEKNNEDEAFA